MDQIVEETLRKPVTYRSTKSSASSVRYSNAGPCPVMRGVHRLEITTDQFRGAAAHAFAPTGGPYTLQISGPVRVDIANLKAAFGSRLVIT